jgi:hypothetical protein
MYKNMSIFAGVLLASATFVDAQSTLPMKLPVNSTPTILGCVAQVQRDGSLAPKAGATATPQTAGEEANNPTPTGVYQLLDARTAGAKTRPTSYSLSGHEAEFAKLEGQRVEVSGTIVAPLGDNRPGQPAAGDGAQRIRVSAVKKIEGQCSSAKK